jgi:solute carrier family 35 protein E1
MVYISLIPIILGVALASSNEITFNWIGFLSAISSNLFYQLRIVFAKKELNKNVQINLPIDNKNNSNNSNISSSNLYRILTVISAIELLPVCLIFEGSKIISIWQKAIESTTPSNLIMNIIISSFSFYMYNEVAFWILDIVTPVTHAIGNTIKRIVIIFASVIILKSDISIQSIIGSFIAITGTFCYALAQNSAKKT